MYYNYYCKNENLNLRHNIMILCRRNYDISIYPIHIHIIISSGYLPKVRHEERTDKSLDDSKVTMLMMIRRSFGQWVALGAVNRKPTSLY